MADNQFTTAAAPLVKPSLAQTIIAPDLATQQMQIARNQQLAAYLRAQGLKGANPTEVIGGWAVKQSPIEGLSRLAQALAGQYLQSKTDEQYSESNRAYSKAMQEQMQAEEMGVSVDQLRSMREAQQPTQASQPQSMVADQGSGDAAMTSPVANPNVVSAPLVNGSAPSYPPAPSQPQPPMMPLGQQAQAGQALKRWTPKMGELLRTSMYNDMSPGAGTEYFKSLMPTDASKRDFELRISPSESRNLELAKRLKDATQVFEANKTYEMPDGRTKIGIDFANGLNPKLDANGNPSISLIPGFISANALKENSKAAAIAAGTEAEKIVPVETVDGVTYVKQSTMLGNSANSGGNAHSTAQQPSLSFDAIGKVGGVQPSAINPRGIKIDDQLMGNLYTTESSNNPNARNKTFGATGLGQITDATYKDMIKAGFPEFDRTDTITSKKAANDLLVQKIEQNGGNVREGIAAYGGFSKGNRGADFDNYFGKLTKGLAQAGQSGDARPVPMTSAQKARAQEIASGEAKNQIKYEETLNGEVKNLQALQLRYAETQKQLALFQAGAFAGDRLKLANALKGLGISKDTVEKIAGGNIGAGQTIENLVAAEVLEQMKNALEGGSGGSAGKFNKAMYDNFNAANLDLNKDPEAFQKVMKFSQYMYNLKLKEQDAHEAWKENNGGDTSKFPTYWNKVVSRELERMQSNQAPPLGGAVTQQKPLNGANKSSPIPTQKATKAAPLEPPLSAARLKELDSKYNKKD